MRFAQAATAFIVNEAVGYIDLVGFSMEECKEGQHRFSAHVLVLLHVLLPRYSFRWYQGVHDARHWKGKR